VDLTDSDVEEIVRLLDSSQYEELKLTTDRFTLILRRAGAGRAGWTEERRTLAKPHLTPLEPGAHGAPAAAAGPVAVPAAPQASSGAGARAAGLIEVRSPLMGTFYRAPKPGAAPYVEVGAKVADDTVVGIVETMKLMNSVYAGARGEVVEICAANSALVEQHDVLMLLKPEVA